MSRAVPRQASRSAIDDRIAHAMRQVIAQSVLTNERIARSVGSSVVDLQTYGLLMLQDEPMTPGAISAATSLPTSTTTRVIDRLEKAGFVRRVADPDDRRRILVHPDRAKVADMTEPYARIRDEMAVVHDAFTDEELRVVARYLEAVAESDVGRATPTT